jgi:hypothetical protein
MKVAIAVLPLITLLLSGCAATIAEEESRIPMARNMPETYGVVFAAVGTQLEKPFNEAFLSIRPQGQGGSNLSADLEKRPHFHRALFWYPGSPSIPDRKTSAVTVGSFANEREKGSVIAAALPAGQYEIFRFTWRWNQYSASTRTYFSIPFEIKAGQAIYLGRFISRTTNIREKEGVLFNERIPEAAFFEVRNELRQDSAQLLKYGRLPKGLQVTDGNLPACRYPQQVRCVRSPAF